jgi:xylulokinase
VLDAGDMMVMYGSTIFIIMLTAERVRDPRLWYAPWLFPGEHASMSGLATSGTLTHWFREQLARELDADTAAEALAAEAASSPAGARGITVLPYFSGERTPVHDPGARGVILGLDLTHTRADLYRAVLEGIAYGTRDVLQTYASAGARIDRITAVGGGTRNAVWTQAVSDATGRPQTVRRLSIGASYGNAFLAAVGVGDVARDEIEAWNPVERTIVPDAAVRAIHDRGFATFKALYAQTRELLPR